MRHRECCFWFLIPKVPCKRQECFPLPLQYFHVRRVLSYFVFAPLVLLFGSLVFHCPRRFVLRVRIFLHIVYLAFIVFFRVSSSFSCAWSGLQFNVWVFVRPSFSSLSRYRLVSISFVWFAFPVCLIAFVQFVGYFNLTLYLFNCYFSVPLYFIWVHLFPFTSCRSSRIKFVC